MIYDLETILNAIVCRARQAKGFLKNGSEAENRIAVEELKKDIDELLKSHTLKGAPNMKTYTVRYTMNNFGFHRRLEDEYRKEYSFRSEEHTSELQSQN